MAETKKLKNPYKTASYCLNMDTLYGFLRFFSAIYDETNFTNNCINCEKAIVYKSKRVKKKYSRKYLHDKKKLDFARVF